MSVNKKENNYYPEVPDKYKKEYIDRFGDNKKKPKILKIVGFFCKFIIFAIIATVLIWFFINSEDNTDNTFNAREFPQLEEPKTITFEWGYKGSKYSITDIFYKTVYDYYNSDLDKNCSQREIEEEICFKKFLEEAEEDNTILRIVSDIKEIASENEFSNDELVEVVVAFVQSIPYDDDKARLITSLPESYYEDDYDVKSKIEKTLPRYPYETLYDNTGICTDKSFLTTSLISKLGYGVALFDFDKEEHIALAIKCPIEYSSYDSGYCFTETTETGFKIGEIPLIDNKTNKPKARTTLGSHKQNNTRTDLLPLEGVEIYEITDGNSYQGVIEIAKTEQKLQKLEKEIDSLYIVINSLTKELEQLEKNITYYEQQVDEAYERHQIIQDYASYEDYEQVYTEYEYEVKKYKSKTALANDQIAKYNKLVDEYNGIIESFYPE